MKTSIEKINATHREIGDCEAGRAKLEQEMGKTLQRIDELHETVDKLDSEYVSRWETSCQKAIEIGGALVEMQKVYGRGWKRDFESLGFDFSYGTATRYIRCHLHPEARNDATSIESWAKAAAASDRGSDPEKVARESRRIQRVISRKEKSTETTSSLEPAMVVRADEQQEQRLPKTKQVVSGDKVLAAFTFLDDEIASKKIYAELKTEWEILAAALRSGKLTRLGVESQTVSDDSVAVGG